MKSMVKSSILVVMSLTLFLHHNSVFANVYAAQLKITNPDGSALDGNFSDGTGAQLSFVLNDTASVVTVTIVDVVTGTTVAQIDGGSMSAGLQSVEWDGAGGEASKQYVFEVTAEQPNASSTDWTIFFDSGDINIFTRGCDVVQDMNSPLFGLFYAPNTGGPLQKGITIYNPDGSFYDPFLVAADLGSGGTVDWGSGTQSMFAGVLDDAERFYVSSIQFGEIRRLNTDNTLTTVITGLTFPKGLWMVGTGADRVLYICDDSKVLRAAIGEEDVFTGALEVVGEFSNGFPRNITIDDDGFMYVSLRTLNDLESDAITLNKYDLSGTLPVTDNNAVWFLDAAVTFRVADLEIDHGADRTTSADDILYFSTRAGDGLSEDGLWRVDDINFPFPTAQQLISDLDLYNDISANVNDRTAIALDPAGNVIFLENSNEHIFFLSPPGEGSTNSFTTTSPDTLTITTPVSVDDHNDLIPTAYRLEANYPNPFNPSTNIEYVLARSSQTTLKIYNLLGEEIRTLVDENQPAGAYSITWDGKDDSGNSVVSGVYVLTLKSGEFRKSQRMTLLK